MEESRVHTTVNLSVSDAQILYERANKLKMKRSELISLLLKKMMVKAKELQSSFETVKYQRGGSQEGWKKVHFFPVKKDYEVFTDMRNNCKISVSFLLSMAIARYLDELLSLGAKKIAKLCDKYYIHHYECNGKVDKNNFCWHIVWGLDERVAKTIPR